MKKISWNQLNELWRNGRLTLTAVIFPIIGFIIAFYYVCRPFRDWADKKLEKIFSKKNDTTKESFWRKKKD